MLNQTFTAENFREIFDSENRKGKNLIGAFFPEIDVHTQAIRSAKDEIRNLRRKEVAAATHAGQLELETLRLELARLKAKKSAAIDAVLEQVSQNLVDRNYKFTLISKDGPGGKKIYCSDGSPEAFFALKQLQFNLHRLYGIKQSNRHDLVSALRDLLTSKFSFEVVRTDISGFYESVDSKRLIKKLDDDQLLSPLSKKFIKQIIESYKRESGSQLGIPRGVGVSAYLAELYLRQVDMDIRQMEGLVLYCRYVDDIVAVFARPPAGKPLGSYKERVINVLSTKGLTYNSKKTVEFNSVPLGKIKFEYLGYRFVISKHSCLISPSARKIRKYRHRLKLAFAEYRRASHCNSRRAYRALVARIKFLTGNVKLLNSKSGAVTGIYYNNSLANDLSVLRRLDIALKKELEEIRRPNLRTRLKKHRFLDGFSQRRFHNFSTRELAMIVGLWKHA